MALMVLMLPVRLWAHPAGGCESAETHQQWAMAQARKIASNLQLPADVADRFVTDYAACQEEIWKLNKTYEHKTSDKQVTTDSDAEKVLKARFEKRRKFNQVQEKYYKRYSGYLTQRQVLALYKAERKLMEQHMRKERKERKRAAEEQANKGRRKQTQKSKQ